MSDVSVEKEIAEHSEDEQADAGYSLAANAVVTAVFVVITLGLFLVAQIFLAESTNLRYICWLVSAAFALTSIQRIIVLVAEYATGKTHDEVYNEVWRKYLSMIAWFVYGMVVFCCASSALGG